MCFNIRPGKSGVCIRGTARKARGRPSVLGTGNDQLCQDAAERLS